MKFNLSVFTGNKFCLFNFATIQTGGFVDIDWFSTEQEFSENKFYDNKFVGASKEALTLTGLETGGDTLNLVTGSSTSITIKAVFEDGHKEDMSIGATYTNPSPEIVRVTNGQIVSKSDGAVVVNISYEGPLGNIISKDIHIISSTFPLVKKLFNPSIYGTGTFNEKTPSSA